MVLKELQIVRRVRLFREHEAMLKTLQNYQIIKQDAKYRIINNDATYHPSSSDSGQESDKTEEPTRRALKGQIEANP